MAVKKSELYSMLWEACNKLRGGVEPSRYKDYVLVLLFFKYVSDRYKGQPFAEFTISKGASFEDLIAAKGKSDVGERVDKIIQKFLEDNRLQGSLPDVSFNNPEELGSGKELVDKVNNSIFSICLDIGHANCYSNQSLEEIIELLGNRIGHLHLSNNNGKKDSHCGLNNGNINVINTLNLIDKYCNDPSMTIEVTDFNEAIESIEFIMERNKK